MYNYRFMIYDFYVFFPVIISLVSYDLLVKRMFPFFAEANRVFFLIYIYRGIIAL